MIALLQSPPQRAQLPKYAASTYVALSNQMEKLPRGPVAIPPHWSALCAVGATATVSAATIAAPAVVIAARFRRLFTVIVFSFRGRLVTAISNSEMASEMVTPQPEQTMGRSMATCPRPHCLLPEPHRRLTPVKGISLTFRSAPDTRFQNWCEVLHQPRHFSVHQSNPQCW